MKSSQHGLLPPSRRLIGVVISLAAVASGAAAAEGPPFASRLPADTLACVWTRNAKELTRRWLDTSLSEVYTDAAMQPFWADVRRQRGGLVPTDQLGLDWDELVSLASDAGWTLAWCGADPSPAGTVLLVDVRGREAERQAALERVRQRWTMLGFAAGPAVTEAGVMVAQGKSPSGGGRFGFVDGDCLCLSDQLALVQQIIRNRDATGASTLPGSKAYRALPENEPAVAADALQFYLDPWPAARASLRTDADRKRLDFYLRHGLGGIHAVVGWCRFQAENDDLRFRIRAAVDLPLSDAAGMLSFDPSNDMAPSPLAPPEAVSIGCLHWNIPKVVQAFAFAYDELYGENYSGAFEDLLYQLAEDPDGPRVDLRKDLFDVLSGKLTSAADFGGARTESNPSGRRRVWMARTNEPEKSARAVAEFFRGDPDVQLDESAGVKIWQSRTSRPMFGGDADNPVSIPIDALAVVGNYFVIASDRGLLKAIAEAKPAESHPLAEQLQWPPGDLGGDSAQDVGRSYRNLVAVVRATYEQVARNQLSSPATWDQWLLWMLLSNETDAGRQVRVDGSLLPPFSTIAHAFGNEQLATRQDGKGWVVDGRWSLPGR